MGDDKASYVWDIKTAPDCHAMKAFLLHKGCLHRFERTENFGHDDAPSIATGAGAIIKRDDGEKFYSAKDVGSYSDPGIHWDEIRGSLDKMASGEA